MAQKLRPPSQSDQSILNNLASGNTGNFTQGDWQRVASMEATNNQLVGSGNAAIYNQPTSGGAPSGTPGGGDTPPPGDTRSAYDAQMDYMRDQETARQNNLISTMRVFMGENGMGELLAGMEKYVRQGYTGDQLWVMVSNDAEYQAAYNKRFAANAARAEKGLSKLLPATYIELESGYRSAMMSRGMPEGLFDNTDDFTDLIANDVSVREAERRLDLALEYINFSGNDNVKQELRDIYGMTEGEMAAYVLDPERTADFLERESAGNLRKAAVGGAAENSMVALKDALRDEIANMYGGSTWERTYGETSQAFTSVAEQTPLYSRLGSLSKEDADSEDLVREQFNVTGAAEAAAKKNRLASAERARFSGRSGIGRTSLASKRAR